MISRPITHVTMTGCGLCALLLAACTLLGTRATDCSQIRPCSAPLVCELTTSTCVPGSPAETADLAGDGAGTDADLSVGLNCQLGQDCADGRACVAGTCQVCQQHDQCAAAVCEHADINGTANRCLNASDVYVVNGRAADCAAADGSKAKPFCTLQEALLATPFRATIRVVGTAGTPTVYTGPFTAPEGKTLRIFGGGPSNPELDRPVLTASSTDTIVSLGPSLSKSALTLDGVELRGASSALRCTGPSSSVRNVLTFVRGLVSQSQDSGIVGDKCDVTLSRSTLRDLPNLAIFLDTGQQSLSNNFIYRNGGRASPVDSPIVLARTSGSFIHNTVVANIGGNSLQNTINCVLSSVVLTASIVYPDPAAGSARSQFSGNCTLQQVVVHDIDKSLAGAIAKPPVFSGQTDFPYKLALDAKNDDCCVDKISGAAVSSDYFGTPRPLGMGSDIGAHELK